MWLAETAVDLETLDIMSELGIKFTILAPHQAHMIKKNDSSEWQDVSGQKIDHRRPYYVKLPSNRTLTIFFYDGPVSRDVSFQDTLDNGGNFANRLLGSLSDSDEEQILSIATDGETYGHHHKYGEMALTYCINHIDSNDQAKITVFGEFLENILLFMKFKFLKTRPGAAPTESKDGGLIAAAVSVRTIHGIRNGGCPYVKQWTGFVIRSFLFMKKRSHSLLMTHGRFVISI